MKITVEFDDGTTKVFELEKGKINTVPGYWDCECTKNFIHPKTDKRCLRCDAEHEDCPDSRLEEVVCMLAQEAKEKQLC